jgi:thioester reductase-like protein
VNWIQPYSALRTSNVLPLKELLRLACRTKAKPFHFVSTLGVGYSSAGLQEIDECSDAFRDLDGIPLPYAQSKLVAEALVRAAGERGLPTTIFRPSFISGHSVNGISNDSDFISALIKGCIQMSAAPDLDWRLDATPVDFTANAVLRLTTGNKPEPGCRVFHIANPHGRYWRELVLWMNLYGYPIQLLPYEEWLRRFRALEIPDFSLRPLAPFFERRLPLRYEESVRRRIRQDRSLSALRDAGLDCPELSPELIERYFATFIRHGFLDAPRNISDRRRAAGHTDVFKSIFRAGMVESVCPVEFQAGSSIINELTSWKYRGSVGLHAYRLKLRGQVPFDVVVKTKSASSETSKIGETVARLCNMKLGQAYAEFSDCLGVANSEERELKIYQHAPKRLRRFMPRFYGGYQSDCQTVLVLERLSDVALMNGVDCGDAWKPNFINAAIDGLAEIHATGYGRTDDLVREIVVGPYPTRESMLEARPLWLSLAEHAKPLFEPWMEELADSDAWIQNLGDSWTIIESMPRTLIHNDFNSRNIALRRTSAGLRLCAYDWELATLGLPQHDLAELLCFVLGPETKAEDLEAYLERHRQALSAISDVPIDKASWRRGFALCLEDLMINRFAAYALIHRFQPQRFLERVVRTWTSLYRQVSYD